MGRVGAADGPGTISFWWKADSLFSEYDNYRPTALEFLVDGEVRASLKTGPADWMQENFSIGEGPHVLKWKYQCGGDFWRSYYYGLDCGFVDQIVWKQSQIVTFDANGGACGTKTATYPVGEAYGSLPEATLDGYAFTGWQTDAGALVTETSMVTTNATLTLHARWAEYVDGVAIGNVTAHQRFPWNGLVDIDYEVFCENPDAEVWVVPEATDGEHGRVLVMKTLSEDGATGRIKAGKHRMTWDAKADNPGVHSTALTVKMRRANATQTIAFAPIGEPTWQDRVELSATASSGGAVTFEVVSGPGKIEENVLTFTAGGTVEVRAVQAGDERWRPATVTQTVTVAKVAQTISFAAIGAQLATNRVELSATATSGLAVTFEIVSGPGVVTGNVLTFTGAGTVEVRMVQAGDERWLPATAMQTVTVAKAAWNSISIPGNIFTNALWDPGVRYLTSHSGSVWSGDVAVDQQGDFKFAANGNWTTSWGGVGVSPVILRLPAIGVGPLTANNGQNITLKAIDAPQTLHFAFDESNLTFSVTGPAAPAVTSAQLVGVFNDYGASSAGTLANSSGTLWTGDIQLTSGSSLALRVNGEDQAWGTPFPVTPDLPCTLPLCGDNSFSLPNFRPGTFRATFDAAALTLKLEQIATNAFVRAGIAAEGPLNALWAVRANTVFPQDINLAPVGASYAGSFWIDNPNTSFTLSFSERDANGNRGGLYWSTPAAATVTISSTPYTNTWITVTNARSVVSNIFTAPVAGLYKITFDPSSCAATVQRSYAAANNINLFKDPSFESGANWSFYNARRYDARAGSDDEPPAIHTGNGVAALLQRRTEEGDYGSISQWIPISTNYAGSTLRVSAWLCAFDDWTASRTRIWIQWQDASGNPVGTEKETDLSNIPSTWTPYSVDAEIPEGAVKANVLFAYNGSNDGRGVLLVDDAEAWFPAMATQMGVGPEALLIVEKVAQTISFEPIGDRMVTDRVTLSAIAASGGAVTFEMVSGPGVVEGNVLTFTGLGAVEVQAKQAGNDLWLPATATQIVEVGRQTMDFATIGAQLVTNRVELFATATSGGGVTFEVVSGPGMVTGNVLTFTGAGTVVVRAVQAGDERWLPVTATQTVPVLRELPYLVVDLSAGPDAASYPVTELDAPPDGGFNTDEYKTTKLVLRRIEPGTFKMGGKYQTTLTKPYYMGVFEVTQKQYELVTGSKPSYFNNAACYEKRPVDCVSWYTIRGNSDTYNWPNSQAVDANSFMGRLRARTGLEFDLPTEAQWEYACRAGTTSSYNNGGNSEDDLKLLGRYWYNGGENYSSSCDTSAGTAEVGSYLPNAWGLYDMHGNVWEWCLDWYGSLTSGATDPVGSSSGSGRVPRGGSWSIGAGDCTSSGRYGSSPSDSSRSYGFRLVRTLSK
jgi:uncharacterized repeat protein (TIGR02543 family)